MKDKFIPKGKGADNGFKKPSSGGPTGYMKKGASGASSRVTSSGKGKDKFIPKGKGYGSGALSKSAGGPTYGK